MPLTLADAGGWPGVLARLFRGEDLDADTAAAALTDVLEGNATSAQIAAYITGLRTKGETVDEMAGLVSAMLRHAEPVPVPETLAGRLVDTCGTGGDRSHSINVSTVAAFVVAGAGAPVCKHGNRAASSAAGSADVLEVLGVNIDLGGADVVRCLDAAGIAFCFAPRFHPAMRHAAPTRRELGVPTVFNYIGPLANPARPRRQIVGVSDPAMAPTMLRVLARGGATHAMVVYGHDGLDELTTTTTSTLLELVDGEIVDRVVDPADLGFPPASVEQLRGGDAATNAALARAVLDGATGPHRDVVVLNAAAALVVAGLATDLADGVARADASLASGAAAGALDRLVVASNGGAAAS